MLLKTCNFRFSCYWNMLFFLNVFSLNDSIYSYIIRQISHSYLYHVLIQYPLIQYFQVIIILIPKLCLGHVARWISKHRAIKLQTLRRDFENLWMKEGELINDFSSTIIEVVEKILIFLKKEKKIDFFINIIEELRDLTQLSITVLVLVGWLQVQEQRISRRNGAK